MSEITTTVIRLEERLKEIRSELEILASSRHLSDQGQARFDSLVSSYGALARAQIGLNKADEALGVYDKNRSKFNETVADCRATLSFKYLVPPPIPKEAALEYSKAG